MPGIEVTILLFAGDEVVWVTWRYVEEEENMPVLRHSNEVISAYVTTGARLKLYTYLDALKEKPYTAILILSFISSCVANLQP
jgi:hypothetical protein